MSRVEKKTHFKVQTMLTDNGKSFTDRFTRAGERILSSRHSFDVECQAHGIEHRLIKPERPLTNWIIERFNGRVSDVLATYRYASGEDLDETVNRYCWLYKRHTPQGGASPSITDRSDATMTGTKVRVLQSG
jgi:transposase InsO family protein